VTLEYQLRGTGEPVVLVHAGVFAAWFDPLSAEPALRDAHRVLVYHRIGYAGSDEAAGRASIAAQAQQLAALMRHLDLRSAHVVGHSSGALIAMQLALDSPAMVKSLVLLEPALPVAGQSTPGIAAAVALYRSGSRDAAIDTFMRAVAGDDYRVSVERALPRAFDQAIADAGAFFDHELPAVRAWHFDRADAQRLQVPVLLVLGARSDEVSPIWRQRHDLLLDWIPGAVGYVLPGSTHLLPLQNPRPLAERLALFFATSPPRYR
jgi:pimeloyl-ACP methyl ester carboxylesterase